MSFKNIT